MKYLITIFSFILTFNVISAQTGTVVFFAEQGESFYLVLNGLQHNQEPLTNVTVNGLNSEYYKAKVMFSDPALGSIDQQIQVPINHQTTYSIKRNKKGKYVVRFGGSVVLQGEPVKSPPVVPSRPSNPNPTTTVHMPSIDVTINTPDGSTTMSTGSISTTMSTGTVSTVGHTTTGEVIGCPFPMNEYDFASAKASIQSVTFDDTKVATAKQVTSSNCLTSAQIAEITSLIEFESSKLEYAKYAYGYVYDAQNYHLVNNAFEFESSIEELIAYTASHPAPVYEPVYNEPVYTDPINPEPVRPYPGRPNVSANNVNCPFAMDIVAFRQAKSTIANQSFDKDKLTIAKQLSSSNCLTADQVKSLMGDMTHESNKIEFAKFAYDRVYDPANYFIVNDALTYSSSVRELNEYIQNR